MSIMRESTSFQDEIARCGNFPYERRRACDRRRLPGVAMMKKKK